MNFTSLEEYLRLIAIRPPSLHSVIVKDKCLMTIGMKWWLTRVHQGYTNKDH